MTAAQWPSPGVTTVLTRVIARHVTDHYWLLLGTGSGCSNPCG